MLIWPDKDPAEVADYQIDWTTELAGDTISASVWTVPTGITKTSDTYTADTATIWLSGGADGVTYRLLNSVTTSGGRTFTETVKITVRSPVDYAISITEAKRQLNILHDDDNEYINGLIAAAQNHVEEYCGAAFSSRSETDDFAAWPSRLPWHPVSGIASIGYIDFDGEPQVVPDTVYELRGNCLRLRYGQQWPAVQYDSLITIVANVGFDNCPPAVKHAMLLWIADAYERRETGEQPSSTTMDALLANHRYYG